jgi:hypothetical protein
MTFCIWCKELYNPHKSAALNPKRYCSLQCEAEAKADKESKEKAPGIPPDAHH